MKILFASRCFLLALSLSVLASPIARPGSCANGSQDEPCEETDEGDPNAGGDDSGDPAGEPSDCESCDGEPEGDTGSNPINPHRGSLKRDVTDLQVFGHAGMGFVRYYVSRLRVFTNSRWVLGSPFTWQHNWNFELLEISTGESGQDVVIRYPNGRELTFQTLVVGDTIYIPSAGLEERKGVGHSF